MNVATLVVQLRFSNRPSSRQKRQALDAIHEKLRRHFNVALIELTPEPGPDMATLALASIGHHRRDAREVLERVGDALAAHPYLQLAEPPAYSDL